MASGKTHLIIGSAAAITMAATQSLTQTQSLSLIGMAALGSLIPDIDNSTSALGKPLFFLRRWQGTYDHRNRFPHTFAACLVFTLLSLILSKGDLFMAGGFFLGYFLHLFTDSYSPQGIRWLWPLNNVFYGACRINKKEKKIKHGIVQDFKDYLGGNYVEQDHQDRICNVRNK